MAANLTVNATVMTARRNSHGYGWGFIRPAITAPVTTDSGAFGSVDYKIRGTYLEPSPAIPHADLGWEITAGFTWELLDGWVVDGRIAYWRPGRVVQVRMYRQKHCQLGRSDGSQQLGNQPEPKHRSHARI